ncbi:MAG: glycoside hydrolase family 16 protein [Bacteroidetes bacterium]|nr:MAG: glycoside hydrolase family 16 protein [Bacteroidota bacterium]
MRTLQNTLIAFLIIAQNSCTKKNQTPALPPTLKYELVWFDEFNADGAPDATKWEYENGFVRNEEAQWYQPENAVCESGNLVITGKKERKTNPDFDAGSSDWRKKRAFAEYTSASLKMLKTQAFRYGKLEVRAKIDAQTGLWPAIWTLGVEGEWPSNGEVDVMEYYGDKILANFAYGSPNRWQAIWDAASRTLTSLGGALWASQYHVWTLEWDENLMRILLDGEFINSIDLSISINKIDGKNPFRQPHFLLLNLAMGGTSGGSLANTVLPSKYFVDYVRVYKKK